jgi:hypothetical protein
MSNQLFASIAQIREIFPQYSDQIIEIAIRECHGNIEIVIAHFLTHTTDSITQRTLPDESTKPSNVHKKHYSHFIFGPDFLRWPIHASTIRVQISRIEEEQSQSIELPLRMNAILVKSMDDKSRLKHQHRFKRSTLHQNSKKHGSIEYSLL